MGQRSEQEKGKETYPPAPSVEEENTSPSDHGIDDDAEELDEEYIQAYLTFKRLRNSDIHDQEPEQEGDEGKEEQSKEADIQIYINTDIPETRSTPSTSSSPPNPPFPLSPRIPSLNQLERSKGKVPRDCPHLGPVPRHHATKDKYHYSLPRITYHGTLLPRQVAPFYPHYQHSPPPPQSRYPGYARYARASLPRLTQGPSLPTPRDTMTEYHGYNSGTVNSHPSPFSRDIQATSRYTPRPYRTIADGNRVYKLADERVLGRQYRGGYNGYNDYDKYSRRVGGSSNKVAAAYTARDETDHTNGAAMAQERAKMVLFEAFAEVCNVTSQIEREVLAVKKMVENALFAIFGEES